MNDTKPTTKATFNSSIQKPTLGQSLSTQNLARALFEVDQRACISASERAAEVALELISTPGGMDQNGRINLKNLLAHGLSPDAHDKLGWTLLMAACLAGDLETVIELRNRGASKSPRNIYDEDALFNAKMSPHKNASAIIDLLENRWIIPEELLKGPKVNEFALRAEEHEL